MARKTKQTPKNTFNAVFFILVMSLVFPISGIFLCQQHRVAQIPDTFFHLYQKKTAYTIPKHILIPKIGVCYLNLDSAGRRCQDLCYDLQNMMQAVAS